MSTTHQTSRGDHTLNVRMLWFRGQIEREEPAMLALDLLSRGRRDDALDVVMDALAESPRDAELLLVAGRVHLERGELDRARDRFIAAARLTNGWSEPFAWLARLLHTEGRATKAAEVAERAVLLGCLDADVRTMDVPRRAQRVLTARARAYMNDPETDDPALLVLSLEAAGRIEAALTILDRALEREPDDEDLSAIRARLRGLDPGATCIDVTFEDDGLDEEAREEAFFRSLGIQTKPIVDPHEPTVIVSDTLIGEPAPRLHKDGIEAAPTKVDPKTEPTKTEPSKAPATIEAPSIEARATEPQPSEATEAFPLVQLAPSRGKRTGWLPLLGRRNASPAQPATTVRVAPQANVARRDPTMRLWLGLGR